MVPSMSNLETPLESSPPASRATRASGPPPLERSGPRQPQRVDRPSGSRTCSAGLHPAVVFLVVVLAGLAVIAALSIALGFFVTRVARARLGHRARRRAREHMARRHRTPARTDASLIGSIVAGGVVLPIIVGSIALVCVVLAEVADRCVRRLRARRRVGDVPRDDARRPLASAARRFGSRSLPVNASYPSGHTAASLAVYGGLALLLTSGFTNRAFRDRGLDARGRRW